MSDIAMRCAHGAICARSLECEHSDSASLDYVASGSTDRAVSSSRLNGATTKRGNRKGCLFLLVEQAFRKSNLEWRPIPKLNQTLEMLDKLEFVLLSNQFEFKGLCT